MLYSKAMVDLIQEARRKAPAEFKPSIKLANPEVLSELAKLYRLSDSSVFKAIVKEIFNLAGDSWPARLQTPDTPADTTPTPMTGEYITRVYRGKTTLIKRDLKQPKSQTTTSEMTTDNKPKRIYRGQIVA